MTKTELLKEYKKLAKRADQRLVRLEQAEKRVGYAVATQWAYARAMKDLEAGFDKPTTRFNVKISENKPRQYIEARIADVERFLDSPTSTVAGINTIYKERAKTINEKYAKYGMNMSWSEMAVWLSDNMDKLKASQYGSETIFRQVARAIKSQEKVAREAKKSKSQHKVLTKAEAAQAVADAMLERKGIDITDL